MSPSVVTTVDTKSAAGIGPTLVAPPIESYPRNIKFNQQLVLVFNGKRELIHSALHGLEIRLEDAAGLLLERFWREKGR